MSCPINKLKYQMLFTCKDFVFRLYVEKELFASGSGGKFQTKIQICHGEYAYDSQKLKIKIYFWYA